MPVKSPLSGYDLESMNSFGVKANAALCARPNNKAELMDSLEIQEIQGIPLLVIGEGTNILFRGDFEGMVLQPMIRGIEITDTSDSHVWVAVGAAENWDRWVEYSLARGWFGLENLSLIPGSAGAAPVQNIGAYGVEVSEFVTGVEALDLTGNNFVHLDSADCRFGYRDSIFKGSGRNRYIITRVFFRLRLHPGLKLDYGNVRDTFNAGKGKDAVDLRETIISIRRRKLPDPSLWGNAGSFFKNPLVERPIFNCLRAGFPDLPHYPAPLNCEKIPAAWLIEKAGWKGKRIGNVGTWPSQPLVIVNYGGATGQEIYNFSEGLREAVDTKFGVTLEREVLVVG